MYDVAIIGCGVIGADTAYALSRYDNKVVILEAEKMCIRDRSYP